MGTASAEAAATKTAEATRATKAARASAKAAHATQGAEAAKATGAPTPIRVVIATAIFAATVPLTIPVEQH